MRVPYFGVGLPSFLQNVCEVNLVNRHQIYSSSISMTGALKKHPRLPSFEHQDTFMSPHAFLAADPFKRVHCTHITNVSLR